MKNLKTKKSAILHPNKTKIFGVESEILIKCKRFKWTHVGKNATLISPLRGKIDWTLSGELKPFHSKDKKTEIERKN